LSFLARRLSHCPVTAGRHFGLVADRLAEIVSFFQHIKPNASLVAEDRPEPRLDSKPAPSQLRLMRRPHYRMAMEGHELAPMPVFLPFLVDVISGFKSGNEAETVKGIPDFLLGGLNRIRWQYQDTPSSHR
jgi:hypothetical protein